MRYVAFILLGLVTAAIGEFQFSVLIRGDWQNLWGSIAFNTVFLLVVLAVSVVLFRVIPRPAIAYPVLGLLTGSAGLMVEWYLIGNSPWGNPDAHQFGMFAFWANMALVPALYTRPVPGVGRMRVGVLVLVACYIVGVAAFTLFAPPSLHFALHIWSVILGYSIVFLSCMVAYPILTWPVLRGHRDGAPPAEG